MKQYILRALRYLVKMVVLLVIIYALMFVTGLARVSAEQFVNELFFTSRGWILFAAIVLLAALYPKFGYVSRTVRANVETDKESIVRAFNLDGYTLNSTTNDGTMIFRASSLWKRIANVGDEKVTVSPDGEGYVTISGIRKQVVQAEFRIKSYVGNNQ